VRAQNILRKLAERGEQLPDFRSALTPAALAECMNSEDVWQLILIASKTLSAVERAIASGEPAHVAKYAFQLAQSFNNFYHEHNVLAEKDQQQRNSLLWVTQYVFQQLKKTLNVLGIEQPAYM
jgi:arginyl-tRNA synthetase